MKTELPRDMCSMMNETKTIHNVLQPDLLEGLTAYLRHAEWMHVPLGEGVEMIASVAPQEVTEALLKLVTQQYDKEFVNLATFCRYNSPKEDTSFRIHSDGLIGEEQPTLAVVYYVNSGETGTALFVHDVCGDNPSSYEERIHTKDDHGWIVTDYCEQKENTTFIYDARKFHSRWPPEANNDRFVIVAFYKEVS